MKDDVLLTKIQTALSDLEKSGDIVLCSNVPSMPAKKIYDDLKGILPSDNLSAAELSGIRALIIQAVADKRFFDWEMPTLTGFNADEFKLIAEKLPNI